MTHVHALRTRTQRRVTELETKIQTLEGRIDAVTKELEDPALYTQAGLASSTPRSSGVELDELKPTLERALEEWGTEATDTLDTLTTGRAA